MKTLTRLGFILAALLGVASLSAAPKEKPAKTPPLLVIPGDPGRPYTVIDNVAGVFEVTYKVTFTKGIGGQDSYQEALGEAFDQVRATAKKNGADAVIHAQFDFVPFADSVIQDEVQLRKARVIGLIKVFGTQVKFLSEEAPKAAEGGSRERRTTDEDVKAVRNNLGQFHAAAMHFMLSTGKQEARYADLVGSDKFIVSIKPVVGEDYSGLVVTAGTASLSVKADDGREIVWTPRK